jgi:hypothetical protein
MKEKILEWHLEVVFLQDQPIEFRAARLCLLAAILTRAD